MIRGGLVSITFRKLNSREIVDLMTRTNLVGIEWGGDVHVPHGEIALARDVAQMTRDAGLLVAAYGSYYRVGVSEADGLAFDARAGIGDGARRADGARVGGQSRVSRRGCKLPRRGHRGCAPDRRPRPRSRHHRFLRVSPKYAYRYECFGAPAAGGSGPSERAHLLAAARRHVAGRMPRRSGCRLGLPQQRTCVSVDRDIAHGHCGPATAGRRRRGVAAIPGANRRHRSRSLRLDRVRA